MESGTDRDDTKQNMDQSTSESLQSGSPTVISLLDRLRSPTPADLSRKRHLKLIPPPKGVKTGRYSILSHMRAVCHTHITRLHYLRMRRKIHARGWYCLIIDLPGSDFKRPCLWQENYGFLLASR